MIWKQPKLRIHFNADIFASTDEEYNRIIVDSWSDMHACVCVCEWKAYSLKIIVILGARIRVREEQRITKLNKYTNMLLDKQTRAITWGIHPATQQSTPSKLHLSSCKTIPFARIGLNCGSNSRSYNLWHSSLSNGNRVNARSHVNMRVFGLIRRIIQIVAIFDSFPSNPIYTNNIQIICLDLQINFETH